MVLADRELARLVEHRSDGHVHTLDQARCCGACRALLLGGCGGLGAGRAEIEDYLGKEGSNNVARSCVLDLGLYLQLCLVGSGGVTEDGMDGGLAADDRLDLETRRLELGRSNGRGGRSWGRTRCRHRSRLHSRGSI